MCVCVLVLCDVGNGGGRRSVKGLVILSHGSVLAFFSCQGKEVVSVSNILRGKEERNPISKRQFTTVGTTFPPVVRSLNHFERADANGRIDWVE